MITASNITLSFPGKIIFDNINLTFLANEKIGLVGANGAGKSTLLRILAKELKPDNGSISLMKGTDIGYLSQHLTLNSRKSIIEETMTVFKHLNKCKEELLTLEKLIETNAQAIERYAELQEEIAYEDEDKKKMEAVRILEGLGLQDFDNPVNELSGGFKMRVILAKLLLQKPDFYFFDEPTNHLDIKAKDWFLDFLKTNDRGFALVTHDRFFLDQCCDKIYELERGDLTIYQGNYTNYTHKKKEALDLLTKRYEEQQTEIKRKKKTIDRFRGKSSKAKMAQSMLKQLAKMDLIELPPQTQKITIPEIPVSRADQEILRINNLNFGFNPKQPLFSKATFTLQRGWKVSLVAPNGKGKTTFFNLLRKKLTPLTGNISFGNRVEMSFFDQEQDKVLVATKTIIDEIIDNCEDARARIKARSMLGAFLFPGDDVYKKIEVLSGGEKNRVAMVKALLSHANFLLLDEPTNHLDIQSKEILLKGLQNYTGTIIFVSHDRDFINHLATHTLALSDQTMKLYEGNYDDYIYMSKQLSENNQQSTKFIKDDTNLITHKKKLSNNNPLQNKNEKKHLSREEQKNLSKLERTIAKLEKMETEIGNSFAELSYGTDEFNMASERLKKIKISLKEASEKWEQLSS